MSAIGPGDWVEAFKGPDYPPVTVGSIWQVEEVRPSFGICEAIDGTRQRCTAPLLVLRGACYDLWCACGFRPIYRPRADLIESLKVPAERVGA